MVVGRQRMAIRRRPPWLMLSSQGGVKVKCTCHQGNVGDKTPERDWKRAHRAPVLNRLRIDSKRQAGVDAPRRCCRWARLPRGPVWDGPPASSRARGRQKHNSPAEGGMRRDPKGNPRQKVGAVYRCGRRSCPIRRLRLREAPSAPNDWPARTCQRPRRAFPSRCDGLAAPSGTGLQALVFPLPRRVSAGALCLAFRRRWLGVTS